MIKTFCRSVVEGNAGDHIFSECFLQTLRITQIDCFFYLRDNVSLLLRTDPTEDFCIVNPLNFGIGETKRGKCSNLCFLRFSCRCQIPCQQQKTEDRIISVRHAGINNFHIQRCVDFFTLHDFCQVISDLRSKACQDLPDDFIIAGVCPERLCLPAGSKVIRNGPWIINLCISKMVTIIPEADFIHYLRLAVVGSHFPDLIFRKAEILAVLVIKYSIDHRIIQAAEEVFLGNTHNSCQDTKSQVCIIFKPSGQEISHKGDDFFIKAPGIALLYRCIIFIDQDHYF